MKVFLRILTIADLHTGCIPDISYFLRVVTDIFDRELNLKHTDVVVLLGDFFDKLFKANNEYIALALDIMGYLITLCRKNKIKLRIVYGTESHEMSQYQIFRNHFSQKNLDVRVIETATEEIIKGVKILYLPEEFVSDKVQFYGKFLDGNLKYDYIFGHGIIEEGWPTPFTDSPSMGKEKHVPRFKSKELLAAGKLILFGHYHEHNNFYLGSLFRWKFGEDIPKGYGIIEDGKLIFVENKEAYQYQTYEYQPDSEIFTGIDKLKIELDHLKTMNAGVFSGEVGGKVRLKLNLPDNLDPSFTATLNGLIAKEEYFALNTPNKPSSTLNDEVADSIDEKYAFVLDKSLPLNEKLYRFYRTDYPDADITMEDINQLIN